MWEKLCGPNNQKPKVVSLQPSVSKNKEINILSLSYLVFSIYYILPFIIFSVSTLSLMNSIIRSRIIHGRQTPVKVNHPFTRRHREEEPVQNKGNSWMSKASDSPEGGGLLTPFQTEGHTFVSCSGWRCWRRLRGPLSPKGQNIRGFSSFWENNFYSKDNFLPFKLTLWHLELLFLFTQHL